MKTFLTITAICFIALLSSCGKRPGSLIGKWEKEGEPRVIIEFAEAGKYFLILGDSVYEQRYRFFPDAKNNNLQIEEGNAAVLAHVKFIGEDRIEITSLRPFSKTPLEYTRQHLSVH